MTEKLKEAGRLLTKEAQVTFTGEQYQIICQLIGMSIQEADREKQVKPAVNGEVKEAKK